MMHYLFDEYKVMLVKLKADYDDLSWFSKLFFPGRLAAKLEEMDALNPSAQEAFEVYQAYKSHTWFFHRWFFTSLSRFNSCILRSRLGEAGFLRRDDAQECFIDIAIDWCLSCALDNLLQSDAHLLSGDDAQAYFNAVAGHQDPVRVVSAFQILSQAGLLSGDGAQANFNAVVGHRYPEGVARALSVLSKAGLLSGDGAQANFNAVAGHQDPEGVASTLELLSEAGFLSGDGAQANFNAVVMRQNCNGLFCALMVLVSAGLLGAEIEQSQERFNKLMEYQNVLLHEENMETSWDRIPEQILTEAHWNHIIQLCRANQVNPEAGRVHFVRYVGNLIEVGHQREVFNPVQSTHTASVHQTVSESAQRLKERYQDALDNLDESLQTIVAWVNGQDRNDIEQRAIQQLVGSSYTFKDSTSNVTTKELLVLSWAAIHDDTMRVGTLQDAQACFLEGLREIQRAYNLSDTFEDRGGNDKQACASGTFNKLIEKLVGIHSDAQITYITNQGAMRKLLPLIREAAAQYLKEHPEDITIKALKCAIYPSVREQLFFEFGHAFEALTKDYDTFGSFQGSDNYNTFDQVLTQRQDEHLEQMIEGKLQIADEELDKELSDLIVRHLEAKQAPEEMKEKLMSREELAARRLHFFEESKSNRGSVPRVFPVSQGKSNKP